MLTTLKNTYTEIVSGFKAIADWFETEEEVVAKPRKPKKGYTRDCTPLNQYHFEFIQFAYLDFIQRNALLPREEKLPLQELTNRLNKRFGMNKSTRSYQRIWSGHVKKEELPVGTLDFEW